MYFIQRHDYSQVAYRGAVAVTGSDKPWQQANQGEWSGAATAILYAVAHDVNRLERVARAVCAACGENPDHPGDARGHTLRWQDYIEAAEAAIVNF